MNKEELIAHFQEQKKIIEAEIAFWQSQPDAEAEKPKRRHGDFGIEVCKEGSYPRLITDPVGKTDLEIYNDFGEIPEGHKITIIFGNIFDLMKDWGEDLDRTSIDGFVLEICGNRIVIGGRRFLIDQATEFHQKLGQMIATQKRKQ